MISRRPFGIDAGSYSVRSSYRMRAVLVSALLVGLTAVSASADSGVPVGFVPQDPLPAGVTITPVDGGPDYYGKFSPSLPSGPNFFPIGVWFESVLATADVTRDKAAGINTYVQLTDDSDLALIRDQGLYALPSVTSPQASGYLLSDEVDMWAGAGAASWTGRQQGEGQVCTAPKPDCGYTVQEAFSAQLPGHALIYANYGKGVTFDLKNPEAEHFVNTFQDIVSADNYWFTDPYICSHVEGGAVFAGGKDMADGPCRLSAHYGWTVDRVRSLVRPGGSKPVWAFVELGHPFAETDSLTATAPQIRAAVWSSVIHGARGVVYFNHSFGGTCVTQHLLRDECGAEVRPTVTAVNQQLTSLAPVLNSPSISGLVSHVGSVDVSVKAYEGHFYLLAAATENRAQTVSFKLACGAGLSASVLGEDRTVPLDHGAFTDRFADSNSVHLYRIDGGNTCGLGLS